jgi:hypothetical protein
MSETELSFGSGTAHQGHSELEERHKQHRKHCKQLFVEIKQRINQGVSSFSLSELDRIHEAVFAED